MTPGLLNPNTDTLVKNRPIFRQGVYKTYPSEVLKKE